MAIPLLDFSIIEVKHPNVGEVKPAGVTADIVFTCEGESSCCVSPDDASMSCVSLDSATRWDAPHGCKLDLVHEATKAESLTLGGRR